MTEDQNEAEKSSTDNGTEDQPVIYDGAAVEVAPGIIEIAGVRMPTDEYIKRKNEELVSLAARERDLRRRISTFIKNYATTWIALASLDWQTVCRQLSWALGDEGKGFMDKIPSQNFIAKTSAEKYVLTHYVRAFAASLLNIEVSRMIASDARPFPLPLVADIGDSEEQILSERVKLWRVMSNMIPVEVVKKSPIISLQDQLNDMQTKLDEILKILRRGY